SQYLETLFNSQITIDIIHDCINEIYKEEREKRRVNEQELLAELYKLRVFDWGGIHQNDINKYIVDNYIKKINSYDNLIEKVENEILHSLKGFVLCSWYNNWTSIIIEDIFKDHQRVLPTVGLIKQVDFFIDDIPFDLKVTYFPKGFMENERRKRKLIIKELSELKQSAKRFNIPFDQNRADDELLLDLITAFRESSQEEVKAFYENFVKLRRDTGVSALMRYILSPLLACGQGVGGGVTLYLITSVSAVLLMRHYNNLLNFCAGCMKIKVLKDLIQVIGYF
ncbi:MAG: hypothetical protein ACKPJQ_19630, partial [Dolichospermum sp.]